ncbi:hypothetical protein BXZ70DRAFT_1008903 [Cristinia sonorae]|uniref:Uncharacterized protein n=1 Tax=Cristinia sonorae TaxID=1940300 RepID=A0A8K0UMJ2_9AGAR|nr:hypothetical protein BXZ70DRAFT_1008903 [Cristinia sonorae]
MASDEPHDSRPASTPSTPSSPMSDDAVNTTNARIYFGPVRSPEKKLAQDPLSKRHTPLRRSTRLSMAPRQASAGPAAAPNLTLNTAENGPLNGDQAQDRVSEEAFLEGASPFIIQHAGAYSYYEYGFVFAEPSSALATKILHAWDNPSPPPSPTLPPRISESIMDLDPLTTDLPDGPFEAEGSESAVSAMLDPQLDPAPFPPSNDQELASPQPDLISFDPTPSPTGTPRPQVAVLDPAPALEDSGEPRSDGQESSATVDDLLTISPQKPPSPSPTPSIPDNREAQQLSDTPQPTTSIEVLDADAKTTENSTPSYPVAAPVINFTPAIELEGSTTPLRRSSRPRRSVSPFVTPLVERSPAAVLQEPPTLAASPSEPLLRSPRIGPARRKSTKGKERESPLPAAATSDVPVHQVLPEVPQASASETSEEAAAESFQRLKSLSPTSSGVLDQLLPSIHGQSLQDPQNNPFIPQPIFSLPPLSSPRPMSPQRAAPPQEPPRTPARRVPIAQAAKEGSLPSHSAQQFLSPRKPDLNAGMEAFGTPAFRRVALDDPTRSPAKRIPISEALLSASKPKQPSLHSGLIPPKVPFVARSKSEEPQPFVVPKKGRSNSVEPSPSVATSKDGFSRRLPPSATATPTKPSALPYPIARTPSRVTSTILEVDETEPQTARPLASSIVQSSSSLRQPPARVESRIPRIGAKPYARPTIKPPSGRSGVTTQPPASGSRGPEQPEHTVTQPRVARRATGKPSSTFTAQAAVPTAPKSQALHVSSSAVSSTSTATVLKRKREEETKVTPTGKPPVMVIRKVVSGSKPASSSRLTGDAAGQSPAKPMGAIPTQGKIQMRKVVSVKQPTVAVSPTPSPEDNTPVAESSTLVSSIPSDANHPPDATTSETHDMQVVESVTSPVLGGPSVQGSPDKETEQPVETPILADDGSLNTNTRRTTRARKSQTDVFGTVAPPSAIAKPSRRARTPAGPDFGAFAGMSALALKSLTASNTIRNQHQVAEIHREVVKMDIKRPDSPTTKVKTVLERQKEDRVKDRQRRAERRALRASGELDGEGMEGGSSDLEDEESMMMDGGEVPLKHPRAPGDEEDYETPPRPERPMKRGRFDDGSGEVDPPERGNDKRVKWNRGLCTTVYLDDSPPKTTKWSRQETTTRGCLTPAAKTLRLDTMGNVLNATVPLADLVQENIIVKKFVYLDDPEPDPPPPDPAVKATRSKSKKAKS